MKPVITFKNGVEGVYFAGWYVAINLDSGEIIRDDFGEPFHSKDEKTLWKILRKKEFNRIYVALAAGSEYFQDDDESNDPELDLYVK